jgi:hypothetical protein
MKSEDGRVRRLMRRFEGGAIRACVLGSVMVASGCSVDATGDAGDVPEGEVERGSGSPTLVREPGGSAPVVTGHANAKRTLLHEVQHSSTRTTRFWDLGYGELIVEKEGDIELDGPPPKDVSNGSALEIFESMGLGAPPAALVAAQARTDEISRRILERLSPGAAGWQLLPGVGPSAREGVSPAAPEQRSFLGNSWWNETACDGSDYENHWQGDTWFIGTVACWDDPMAWVNSGSFYKTKAWEAMYWGYGSDVTYKHWWVGCTDYILWKNCSWQNDTSTSKKGTYRTWSGGGLTTDRAGEIRTPNNNSGSAMFSIKTYTGT